MKTDNVTALPSASAERPLFGLRPEDALRYMIQELNRMVRIAEKAVSEPARGFATAIDLAHLRNMYLRAEIMCQIAMEAFPFSDFQYKKHLQVYKAHGEHVQELYLATVRHEAEIALNCKKAEE